MISLFRSVKVKKAFDVCSHDVSINCFTTKLNFYPSLVKCFFHLHCCSSLKEHTFPSSSFTILDVMGIMPLLPLWMVLIHFHKALILFHILTASSALCRNRSSLASLTAFHASLQAITKLGLSLCTPVKLYNLFLF